MHKLSEITSSARAALHLGQPMFGQGNGLENGACRKPATSPAAPPLAALFKAWSESKAECKCDAHLLNCHRNAEDTVRSPLRVCDVCGVCDCMYVHVLIYVNYQMLLMIPKRSKPALSLALKVSRSLWLQILHQTCALKQHPRTPRRDFAF